MPQFVHLHVHTEFSLLDSLARIPDLIAAVADADMPAVAMTDAASLHGAPLFMREARRQGIRPIFGVEFEMAPRAALATGATGPDLVAIAPSVEGWLSLVRLVSEAHLQSAVPGRPVLSESALLRHTAGLIVLIGGNNGEISRLCRAGLRDEAVETLARLAEAFGRERVFVELQHQRLPGQDALVAALREVARRVGVRCVATNNVHYLRREQAEAHRCLRCVRRGIARADDGTAYSAEFYLKRPEEMAAVFADAPDALEASVEIAAQCESHPWPPDTSHFPRYRGAETGGASIPADELLRVAWAGFRARWATLGASAARTAAAERRLERELEAAIRAGVANYLLVHADLVRRARERGIAVVPSRAGAASSLLAWALGLTDVRPTRWSLPSERCVNPDHPSLPELSLDVAPHQRAELIALIREAYGAANVAHAGGLVVFGARSAVREVGRALGVPADRLDELAALVGESGRAELRLDRPEVRERLQTRAARWPDLMRFAAMFEGLPRGWAVHPSAIVLADAPVGSIVPLSRAPDGDAVTQFDVRDLPRFGLVRTDVPASRAAALLGEAARALRAIAPAEVELLDRLEGREAEVVGLIRRGDVVGIPGLESPVVLERERRARIRSIEDLAPWLAIQAADAATLAAALEEALAGRRQPDFDDPAVQRRLRSTGGMLLFEEQAMRLLEQVAGVPSGFADLARRAEQARDDELRRRMWACVRAGARRRKVPESAVAEIWAAALECFRRRVSLARGAALATAAWRAAWVKARHPAVFYAAALTAEAGDAHRATALLREARARGLALLGPDANESDVFARPCERAIRLGWTAVRGVRPEAASAWVAERRQHGPYRDLADFARRLAGATLGRATLAHLVRAGAFDSFGVPRARLLEELDSVWAAASAAHDVRQGQALLFEVEPDAPLAPRAPSGSADLWAAERELIGVVVSVHPLTAWDWWRRTAVPAEGEAGQRSMVTGVPVGVAEVKADAVVTFDTLDGVERVRMGGAEAARLRRRREPMVVPVRRGDFAEAVADGPAMPVDEARRRVVEVRVLAPPGGGAADLRSIANAARAHPGTVPLRVIGVSGRMSSRMTPLPRVAVLPELVCALETVAGPGSVAIAVDLVMSAI